MAGILDIITSQLDDKALGQLGNQLGTSGGGLAGAIGAALPMLLSGLERNARTDAGAESLRSALNKDHDGGVLNDLSSFFGQQPTGGDGRMVDRILGTKRPGAERSLSKATGLDQGAIGSLLQNLAPLVMGALGQKSRSLGLDAGTLASMLGGEARELGDREPSTMGALDRLFDADGDGDTDFSDLAQQGVKILGGLFR